MRLNSFNLAAGSPRPDLSRVGAMGAKKAECAVAPSKLSSPWNAGTRRRGCWWTGSKLTAVMPVRSGGPMPPGAPGRHRVPPQRLGHAGMAVA